MKLATITEEAVITKTRTRVEHVDYCPHCKDEIREKSLFCDCLNEDGTMKPKEQHQWYHRPCGGKIEFGRS